MKYEAWLNTNFYYKLNLIKKLSYIQYQQFLNLFFINVHYSEYILIKKLYLLLDAPYLNYTKKELLKLNKIATFMSLKSTLLLFNKMNHNQITTHNAKELFLYLKDEPKFKKHKIPIDWGPGNHGDKYKNIINHYNKHCLSEEGVYWKKILNEVTINNYQQYAIDHFYKMTKVMVHTDGKHVHLSGFYGSVFIIGRYNEDIFGISSCYYVENGDKYGRYNGQCFKIYL